MKGKLDLLLRSLERVPWQLSGAVGFVSLIGVGFAAETSNRDAPADAAAGAPLSASTSLSAGSIERLRTSGFVVIDHTLSDHTLATARAECAALSARSAFEPTEQHSAAVRSDSIMWLDSESAITNGTGLSAALQGLRGIAVHLASSERATWHGFAGRCSGHEELSLGVTRAAQLACYSVRRDERATADGRIRGVGSCEDSMEGECGGGAPDGQAVRPEQPDLSRPRGQATAERPTVERPTAELEGGPRTGDALRGAPLDVPIVDCGATAVVAPPSEQPGGPRYVPHRDGIASLGPQVRCSPMQSPLSAPSAVPQPQRIWPLPLTHLATSPTHLHPIPNPPPPHPHLIPTPPCPVPTHYRFHPPEGRASSSLASSCAS